MATVGLLVAATANLLRYKVTPTDATTLVITCTGAASPDLITDAVDAGPINAMSKAFTTGYGQIAAGAMTQAQARALWLNDNSGGSIGGDQIVKASCQISGRAAATGLLPTIDANVDGAGKATLTVTPPAGASTFYVDIEVRGGVGAQ